MQLAHLHLPGLTRYHHAARLQQSLVAAFLAFKAGSRPDPPRPTIITAEFSPVYTCGRRELNTVSADQQLRLRSGGAADFHEALRGGQTTFHGPGQLVAYPILDLQRQKLSPRCYVNLLEETVIRTCAAYGINGFRTENPGVWTDAEHKIAAVGVHLRRNVSSHGIGLNVSTDLAWFDRIVACGLAGKHATSFERLGVSGKTVEEVAERYVQACAETLSADGVVRIAASDVQGELTPP